jgi:hypothetical protein
MQDSYTAIAMVQLTLHSPQYMQCDTTSYMMILHRYYKMTPKTGYYCYKLALNTKLVTLEPHLFSKHTSTHVVSYVVYRSLICYGG